MIRAVQGGELNGVPDTKVGLDAVDGLIADEADVNPTKWGKNARGGLLPASS